MPVLVYDPFVEERIRSERGENPESNRYDEVWEGILVMVPVPDIEHQRIVMRLASVLSSAID